MTGVRVPDSGRIDWRLLGNAAIWAGALGYLVDIFDLNLDSSYRQELFRSFGVSPEQTIPTVVAVGTWSRSGLLCGGFLWGILGDRLGRLISLFGSIALYSVAVLSVAIFCHSLAAFKVCTFFVGLGLAGELGGSVTLVLESLPATMRTFGVMIVAAMGMLGVVIAGVLVEFCSWRVGYGIGGGMGLLLLIYRFRVRESLLFQRLEKDGVSRGNWFRLLWPWPSLRRYLACTLLGVPPLFVLFLYGGFAPEIGHELQLVGELKINRAQIAEFSGLAVGDLMVMGLSYRFRSRKRPILWSMAGSALLQTVLFGCRGVSVGVVYAALFLLGMVTANALYVTTTAEQFGTNLRDTATTTVTNFIRFGVLPLSYLVKGWQTSVGLEPAGLLISLGTLFVGILALAQLQETYGASIDFVEEAGKPVTSRA